MARLIAFSVLYKLGQQQSLSTPTIDPTKFALEIEATAMRNFLTSQAATLWPSKQTQTETPTPPTVTQPSFLVFPYISADAGNFALLAGETITFTWENAPTGADKYEFVLVPLNKEPSFVLGIDFDDSDGVAVSWTIPEHIAAELHATGV